MTSPDAIADRIAGLAGGSGRAIVGVDGIDGAGKTTFADRLAPVLERRGRAVIRASVDGFHNERAIRHAAGRSDPLGYFRDPFDHAGLIGRLLEPFRTGQPSVETAIFDHRADCAASVWQAVPPSAVLLVDGIFLHRDEILPFWDFSIFLEVPVETAFQRLAARDGFDPDPAAPGNRRYREGQMIYLATCDPRSRADLVVCT